MGLFDMFGAGGGSVSFQLQSPMVQAGSALSGNVVFTGGKRAQQVTKVTLRMTQETRSMRMTNTGPQPHTESRDVVQTFQVVGAFTTTPGQPHAFPFQIPVPQGAPNTTPGQVTYHLRASVDIDNEVDPGASIEVQVVGGTQPQMQPQMGVQPQMPMGMQPQMGMPMQIAPGTHVVAVWGGDGQMHPGRVVAFQNGMYGVDWDEPRLGATTYVHPQQVQVAQGHAPHHVQKDVHAMHKSNDPMHKNVDPMHKNVDPMHKGNANAPYGKGHDPMHAGMHKGQDPYGKGTMGQQPQTVGTPPQMGSHVVAQHPNGQWTTGRVAAIQNGMIGVDWDDPKLGQSTWVQPAQVRSK